MAEDSRQQFADGMTAYDAYYDCLHEMYGRPYPAKEYAAHRMWKKFMKVGDTCRKHGWDIVQYVRTLVEYSQKDSASITPSDLVGAPKEQLFLERRKATAPDTPEKTWALRQRDLIRIQVATGVDDIGVLASPLNVGFPAWFRIFYPEHMDIGTLTAYWSDAVEEMRENRDIVRFLRAVAPARLAAAEKEMGVVDGI